MPVSDTTVAAAPLPPAVVARVPAASPAGGLVGGLPSVWRATSAATTRATAGCRRLGGWADPPRPDAASNPADALRQFAQGYREIYAKGERPKSWRDRLGIKNKSQGSAQAA